MNADDINAIIENASNLAFQNDQEIALSFGEGPDMVSITVNPLGEEEDDEPLVPRSNVEIITNGVVSGLLIIACVIAFFFFVGGRVQIPA